MAQFAVHRNTAGSHPPYVLVVQSGFVARPGHGGVWYR